MKKIFKYRNNSNFYHLKQLQWSNKAMKGNKLIRNNSQNIDSINYLKEKSWNKRFIYDKIQNYDSTKDKNVFANLLNMDEMNCYHNAIKKNDLIMKSFYSNNKFKRKPAEEYNKTNIKITLNPLGKNITKTKIINNSFSTNKFVTKNRITFESLEKKRYDVNEMSSNENLNKINNNPQKLNKIWKDLCILQPYKDLFNIILSQLSEERKADICEREYKELYDIRKNILLLSASVYYRIKILEDLKNLNDKLGITLKSKQITSNEVIIKNISDKIENLREHTINICFLMRKIKSKINEDHQWGKFNFNAISERYMFDKNYLIKMKEEMSILKEGYAKYFFNVGDDNDPFLLQASDQNNNNKNNNEFFKRSIPLSDEMRENINQCIYIIYQELIGYQNNNILENNMRNISPLKKYKYTEIDIKMFRKQYSLLSNYRNKWNNNIDRNIPISPSKTTYSDAKKSPNKIIFGTTSENNNDNKTIDKDDVINNQKKEVNDNKNENLNDPNFKNNNAEKISENIINILSDDTLSRNNPINNNTKEIVSKKENDKISNISDIDKNLNNNLNIKKEDDNESFNSNKNSKIPKDSNLNMNKINNKNISSIKSKNLIIKIFNEDINAFSKDFYSYYFFSIPDEIKNMFKIEKNIIKNLTQDISPYMLILYENMSISQEINDNNWIRIKNYILGICIFSFEFKNNLIKLNINHISNSIAINPEKNEEENKSDYIEDIKYIFNMFIQYIKNNFYFDEIIVKYNILKKNEQILNLFLNDFNFIIPSETENEEINKDEVNNKKIKEIGANHEEQKDKEKNEIYYKMIYTNDSSKNRVDELIRETILKYIDKNILDIFDSVVITNTTELISSERKKSNDFIYINNILMRYLLEKKERTNVNKIYNKINNLDQLIKIFQNNNINNKEIPLSLAENRFDIISSALNKTIYNNYFSNSIFFNNYSTNNPCSYLDNNTGIYYNFIKVDKLLILENDKYYIKIYHILNNNLGLFFCKVSDEFSKYLNNDNFYIQFNNAYKETLSLNKKQIINDAIIWLPCFEIYKHFKTLSNNNFGTFHEYVKISNKVIRQSTPESLLVNNSKNKTNDNQFKIIPDLGKDILIEKNFILGIINNAEILNEEGNKNNNKNGEPYAVFLSLINKNNFIINKI